MPDADETELPPDVASDAASSVPDLPAAVEEVVSDLEHSDDESPQGSQLPSDLDEDSDVELPDADPQWASIAIPGNGPHRQALQPTPDLLQSRLGRQDIAEFYSPGRVVQAAGAYGLIGDFSADILTGWDFKLQQVRGISLQLLAIFDIFMLIICPPCTAFSVLQRLWNFKKMSHEKVTLMLEEGMLFLKHAMESAEVQVRRGMYFIFEHPCGASSWEQPIVKHVAGLPGVKMVTFDQCMFGLVSPLHKTPMRKRTRLMTNSPAVVKLFHKRFCDRSHDHKCIAGEEGGIKISVWAQRYPPALCNAFVEATCMTPGCRAE